MVKNSFLWIITLTILLTNHVQATIKKYALKRTPPTCQTMKDGPATIFIHGTIFPVISRFTHGVEYPTGLISYMDCQGPNRLTRMAEILSTAAPEQFSLESFYFYCWPGKPTFEQRKLTAKDLYTLLKMHTGPVTIIAHSHGCNVALYLAQLAAQEENDSLSIDRLILCACPVQVATAHLVTSPIFNNIYSFYSTADLTQIIDPQGLYEETKKVSKDAPLFSQRLFEDAPNLIQTRILMDGHNPGHQSFVNPRFLRNLPFMISLLEDHATNAHGRNCIIDIPRFPEKARLIETIELAERVKRKKTQGKVIRHDKRHRVSFQA